MSPSRAPRRRRSTSGRAILLTAVSTVGAVLLTACGASDGGSNSTGSGSKTGYVTGAGGVATVARSERQAVPKIDGKTVDGGQLSLDDYKGKVVVVNVWGSWCPPCRAEAPHFAKVSKELKAQGVEFVGINTRDNSVANAAAFEQDYDITYPSLYDPIGKLMLRFPKGTLTPQGIPSTLVLDREGRIAARALTALGEKNLRSMIAPVLAEK
ncbi:TlpA family protein disulfide reductase [Streptomyces sp. NPDC006879]|uniref:TlpA family protein disulfide reductase n=1 Tax=Streptomyces sp. NPDC006879 TaxID=3364767 RepID=UPI0036CDF345